MKKYGCNDEKVSPYNVLKLKSYDFERIFVFFKDDGKGTLKENKIDGEKKLEKLMKGLKVLAKILSTYDENLYG